MPDHEAAAVQADERRLTGAGLPPKWHGADYAERRARGIRNRPDAYKQNIVLNDDIDWLLEEIDWLNQQLAARASAHTVSGPAKSAALPPRGPDGFRDITCGLCDETFGTNFHSDEIQCANCEARRCPDCGSWFGAEEG